MIGITTSRKRAPPKRAERRHLSLACSRDFTVKGVPLGSGQSDLADP